MADFGSHTDTVSAADSLLSQLLDSHDLASTLSDLDDSAHTIWNDEVALGHGPDDHPLESGGPDPSETDPTVPDPAPSDTDPSEPTDVDTDDTVGDPQASEEFWFEQAVNGWCGPASAAEVIAEATGSTNLEATELEVVARAEELGLLTHDGSDITSGWSGMYPDDIATLLQSFGVPAASGTGDLSMLEDSLANGDRIIVSVDSGMIWNAEGDLGEQYDSGTADHALVVTGIDEENGIVYLNDPGRPEGAATHVPLEVFEAAWATGGNAVVVADGSPQDTSDTTDATTIGELTVNDIAGMLAAEGSKFLLLPITVGPNSGS